jgi:GntR family transcriptional regulator, galactonate operon transcriptional repressor
MTGTVPLPVVKLRGVKPRVHDGVVRDIALRILSGTVRPGQALPTEAELQAEYAISRSALREAIRVLSAKGLMDVSPRIGTVVREPENWNRLDPDVLEWSLAITPDLKFVRSLLEARRIFEPAAAELAAERASAQDVGLIEAAYLGMAASLPHAIDACCQADVAFHAAVLRASHNVVLQQLVSTMEAALGNVFRLSTQLAVSHERALSAHATVLECIRVRDAAGARAAMEMLLRVAFDDLGPLITGLVR